MPIDVLGDGFVVAPPSLSEKGRYEIIQGSLADLPRLPRLRNPPALVPGLGASMPDPTARKAPASQGHRNKTLWRLCMHEAPHCDDLESLIDVARTANDDCVPPLADAEVVKLAGSAWSYTERGQNLMGKQHIRISFDVIDELLAVGPDAYVLFSLLLRHHADRTRFFIANAMAESMPPDGWALRRFRSARARLLENGFVVRVRKASSMYGAAVYGWGPKRS
jgi:hypothetical protein